MAGTIKTVSKLELQGFNEAKRKIDSLVKARQKFEAPPKRGGRLVSSQSVKQIERLVQLKKQFERPWKVRGIQGLEKLKGLSKTRFQAVGISKVAKEVRELIKLKKEWEKPAKNPFRNIRIPQAARSPRSPKPEKLSLFNRVLQDLSQNTLGRFSAATGLSAKTAGSLASAVGVSTTALTGFAAVAGPTIVLLGGLAAGVMATAAGYTFAATKAAEYQVATQGVAKTTDLVGVVFENTRQRLIDMSTDPQLGQTAKELAGITQVAGTLGIRGEKNLSIFTEAVARLIATSDIAGEQGTQQLGKFLSVTRRQASETLSLSSALSGLAANYATTESAALSTGLEVAKGGVSFNLAAEDALAMGAVYEAYGIQAELARTATLRLGQTIQSAVLSGGKDLERLAEIAGVSAEELSRTFKDDAGEGIEALLRGFKRLSDQEQDVAKVLDSIGLKGVRLGAVIPTLAKNVDELDKAMSMAADESRNPSRIFAESANMADTTSRRFATLKNEVTALAIRVGDELLPALDNMIETASGIVDVAETMQGSLGTLGDTILSKIAKDFELVGKSIQFASDAAQFGVGGALFGVGDYVREAQKVAAFRAEIEELNEVAKSGSFEEMVAAFAGVQSTIGEAESKAARYEQKLKDLMRSTNNGKTATDRQKDSIRKLSIEMVKAQKKAEKYRAATADLREEIEFLERIRRAGAAEAALVAAQAEKERKAREEAREEAEKYREELERLGESITEKFLTPAQKAAKEIAQLDELLAKSFITFETWEKGVNEAKKGLKKLTPEVKAYNSAIAELDRIQRVTDAVQEFGVDASTAAEAVKLATDANIALADAMDLVLQKQLATQVMEFESSGGFLGIDPDELARMSQDMADIWELGRSGIDKYRDEVAKLEKDLESGNKAERLRAEARLEEIAAQTEGWVKLGAKIVEVAEETGGIWGRVLEGIGNNLGEISNVLGDISQIASQTGNKSFAEWAGVAQTFAAGDMGGGIAGAIQASGIGQQTVSQFGGLSEGDFMAEGAQLGAKFGGAWGAVIGGVVGAFVTKGADDLHSHTEEVAGRADLIITQAEGGLAEIAGEIEGIVETYLNGIQDALFADLDLTGVEVHIREDRVRVVANGIEKVFDNLTEAYDFIIRGVMQANAGVEGLGEATRALFENASQFAENAGDPERLIEAFNLAQRVDFEETGIDQQVLKTRQKDLALLAEFGIPFENYIKLRERETRAVKDSIQFTAAGIVGVSDVAAQFSALSDQARIFNNTQTKASEVDRARIEELRQLIAAQEESNEQVTEQVTGVSEENRQRGDLIQGLREGRDAQEGYTQAQDDSNRAVLNGATNLDRLTAELEALENATDTELVDVQFIADMINAGVAQAAVNVGNMILNFAERGLIDLSADERIELRRQLFEMEKVSAIAQLHATSMQIKAMLALGEVSANVAGVLTGFLNSLPGYIEDIAGATFNPRVGRGGGGRQRRQQAQEEANRAAEEAAQTLADFSNTLRTLELNASTTSYTLGDLANQIATINQRAIEALEAGADAADVQQFQRLEFRGLRRQVTEPFSSFGRDSFRAETTDIEQMRRAAIAEAEMIAQAQADALGIPFEAAFRGMEREINDGAARMQRALTQGLVDSLGLPLENVRKEMRDFKKQLRDLEQAYKSGNITQRRYKQLLEQIQAAQAQALGGDVLSMLDKYYSEVEGREDFRRQLAIANYELELATAQLRFNTLVAEGALSQANIELIGGFLDFMANNPPDWDAFFAPPESGGGFGSSSFASSGQGTTVGTGVNLDSLIAAINNFINGFTAIDMGQFERMAHDFITSISGFQTDLETELDTVLSTGFRLGGHALKTAQNFLRAQTGDFTLQLDSLESLTDEQLQMLADADLSGVAGFQQGVEDVFDAMLALQNAEELKPQAIQNVLSAYRKLPEETSQLAGEFRTINSEFADVMTALEMLGASEQELQEARLEHARQLLEFEERALRDIRSVGEDISRGQVFGNVTARQRVGQAEQRLSELRARIAADPADFEAIEAFGPAMREVLDARRLLTGGVGPEFTLALERIRALSEGFELDLGETVSLEQQSLDAAKTTATLTEEQTQAFKDGAAETVTALYAGFEMTEAATRTLGENLQPAIVEARSAAQADMELQRILTQQHINLTSQTNLILDRVDESLAGMLTLMQEGRATAFQLPVN